MKKLIVAAALVAAAVLAAPSIAPAADAKKGKNVELKAQVSRGGEADPNIKSGPPKANKAAAVVPTASRDGRACTVHIDNRTGWYIQIYLDGDYRGVVGPMGDGYGAVISGPTRFYARAEFDDGSVRTWGPDQVYCPDDATYTLNLYR
jgi:hypothetical protein